MTRRFPIALLALSVAIALGLLWSSLSKPRGETSLERELEFSEHETTSPELSEAPRASEAPAQDQREVAAPDPPPANEAFEIPGDAHWIEGRVVFPKGLPLDEQFEIEARGRHFGKGASAPRTHRVKPKADGHFRVAFDKKTKKGRISIEARYMYLPTPVKVDLREQVGEVLIEPLLGGILRSVISPPPGQQVGAGTFEGVTLKTSVYRGSKSRLVTSQVADDGTVELLCQPPRDDYWISLHSIRFAGEELTDITVRAGEVTEVELALTLGVHLSGRVVLPSGKPVVGASVKLRLDSHKTSRRVEGDVRATDEEGYFEFNAAPTGHSTLSIQATGKVEIIDDLGKLNDGDRRVGLVYTAEEGGSIRGVVTWEDGTPVANADIGGNLRGTGDEASWSVRQIHTRTDEDGHFTLSGLDQGTVEVVASHKLRSGKGSVAVMRVDDVRPGTHNLRLVLPAGNVLRGVARSENGEPLKRIQIKAQPRLQLGSTLDRRLPEEHTIRTELGEFELSGLGAGAWSVSVRAKDHEWSTPQEIVLPDEAPLEFVLTGWASVKGVVRMPTGAPAAGVKVRLRALLTTQGADTRGRWVKSNDQGEFELGRVQSGSYQLWAEAGSTGPSKRVLVSLAPGEAREAVVLSLTRACHLTGRLLPSIGSVAGRSVTIYGHGSGAQAEAMSDEQGHFEITGLGPGKYTAILKAQTMEFLDAMPSGKSQPTVSFELLAGETTHIEFEGGPQRSVRVQGVVTSGGSPLANCHLNFMGEEGSHSSGRTDENGSYAVMVSAQKTYEVAVFTWVSPSQSSQLRFTVDVGTDAEQRQDFDLPIGSLNVALLRPGGAPGGSVTLTLVAFDVESQLQGSLQVQGSNAEGYSQFLHLAPGTYRLRAGGEYPGGSSGSNYTSQVIEFELSEGEHKELTVQLEPSGTLQGSATYADGSPAVSQAVAVFDASGRELSGFVLPTDASGHFQAVGMPSGELTVRIGELGAQGQATVSLTGGGQAEVLVTVPR